MALLLLVLTALKVVVVVDAVASWFVAPDAVPRSLTRPLLDPVYAPVRDLMPQLPVDLTPLLALAVLYILEAALRRGGPKMAQK